MAVECRFLIAPALARLIERESAAATRIVEGHFPPRPNRTQLVRVERDRASLILSTPDENGLPHEEHADVPRAHAEALIDVAGGTIAFDRIPVSLGGDRHALLDRFILPEGINLLTIVTESGDSALDALDWFGPDVTDRPEFERSALALDGAPPAMEVAVSNAALEALLDTLDGRTSARVVSTAPKAETPRSRSEARPIPDRDGNGGERPFRRTSRSSAVELDHTIARLVRSVVPARAGSPATVP